MRSFTLVIGNAEYGRYLSRTPSGAARKMASKVLGANAVYRELFNLSKGATSADIVMRETTAKSNHKEYTYRVTKELNPKYIEPDEEEKQKRGTKKDEDLLRFKFRYRVISLMKKPKRLHSEKREFKNKDRTVNKVGSRSPGKINKASNT